MRAASTGRPRRPNSHPDLMVEYTRGNVNHSAINVKPKHRGTYTQYVLVYIRNFYKNSAQKIVEIAEIISTSNRNLSTQLVWS